MSTPLKAIFTGADVTALAEFASGDSVPVSNGGTGATNAADARAALGLVIGIDVQAPLVPGTDYVTPTGTETLTNKTLTGYKETGYSLTGTVIDPANGSVQYKTLSANTTFTESLADGHAVTLMLNPSTYTVTWPTITWIGTTASAAPTLVASVYNCIVLFQLAGTVYGRYAGRV